MKFDIITIFPDVIKKYTSESILKIAQEKKLVEINIHNLRNWTEDKHNTVDDSPYGGGPGMVMKLEPVFKAIEELKKENTKVIITTPKGKQLKQDMLVDLSSLEDAHYIIICGHYEGFDQRIHDHLVDMEISVGDYVLSGGELPALILVDGITRLIPGVLGNDYSLENESFTNSRLDFPQYTKPAEFNNWKVPAVLLSGDHKKIKDWREEKSLEQTKKNRPDIL